MRRKLDNLTFIIEEDFTAPFSVHEYKFSPQQPKVRSNQSVRVINGKKILNDNRRHSQNAYVQYSIQEDSVLFKGGQEGNKFRPRKRKFLDDILVLGSIFTAQNWGIYSRRNNPQYPVVSRNHLEYISKDANQCREHLELAVIKIKNRDWQKQFDNGFHFLMLLNHANILNSESRFLSMVVIWEWLYPHLKNANGAVSCDESNNLHKIFTFILKYFWPSKVNNSVFVNGKIGSISKNIFYVLRNQLAHSGRLPIDRDYAEQWMKNLNRDNTDYLKFFDRLTQILVLKTIGIDGEESLRVFNFPEQLSSFLSTGKI